MNNLNNSSNQKLIVPEVSVIQIEQVVYIKGLKD